MSYKLFSTILFLSGCLMIAIAILFDTNYLNYKLPIPYSKWKEISYEDFKGLYNKNFKLDIPKGYMHGAYIVSDLNINKRQDVIDITTYFYPSRSYMTKAGKENPMLMKSLLNHELYHLHITECGARMLRLEISSENKPVSDSILDLLTLKYIGYIDSLNNKYDSLTQHGIIVAQQKNWQHIIDSCLNDLKEYENPMIKNK